MASIPEARASFNLKVLRRHDASIVEIVETASFVVLYNYNGGEWTKTGVEGPLFLFRRRLPPYNGFFLMNRNGVENFSADVTPDDDLEITPEFIIYRPETSGDNEVYGIWVFEPNQRMAVGDRMLKLQQMVEAPSEEQVRAAESASSSAVAAVSGDGKAVPTAATAAGKEVGQAGGDAKSGKGKTNGKAKKGAKQTTAERTNGTSAKDTPAPAAKDGEASTQINLDDLFGSVPAPAPAAEAPMGRQSLRDQENPTEQTASNGASLLDSLFQSAVSLDPTVASNVATTSTAQTTPAASTGTQHAPNLLSLLGTNPSTSTPSSQPDRTNDHSEPPAQSPPTSTPQSTNVGAPKMSDLLEQGIRDRIGLDDDGNPLTKREFVTQLLSMVHTNPEFVTELYSSYLARVA